MDNVQEITDSVFTEEELSHAAIRSFFGSNCRSSSESTEVGINQLKVQEVLPSHQGQNVSRHHSEGSSSHKSRGFTRHMSIDSSRNQSVGSSRHHSRSAVVEQSCLRPSVAKSLFMQLGSVQVEQSGCEEVSYCEEVVPAINNVSKMAAQSNCHCLACCRCSPKERLNGVCRVYVRRSLSTTSLDRGMTSIQGCGPCQLREQKPSTLPKEGRQLADTLSTVESQSSSDPDTMPKGFVCRERGIKTSTAETTSPQNGCNIKKQEKDLHQTLTKFDIEKRTIFVNNTSVANSEEDKDNCFFTVKVENDLAEKKATSSNRHCDSNNLQANLENKTSEVTHFTLPKVDKPKIIKTTVTYPKISQSINMQSDEVTSELNQSSVIQPKVTQACLAHPELTQTPQTVSEFNQSGKCQQNITQSEMDVNTRPATENRPERQHGPDCLISAGPLTNQSVSCNPSRFKEKADDVEGWFMGLNDDQKNTLFLRLLRHSDVVQKHFLCELLGTDTHPDCPPNCQDRIAWLPESLVLSIFCYLDPVSLARAAQVCHVWRLLVSESSVWRQFCRMPKWKLSRTGEQKQILQHMGPEGVVQWKSVFAERFHLRENWLRGRCTVRTFEGHMQGISCVQFDDTRIVSGSSDKTIKVWNIRTNSPWSVQTLVGHSGTVRCLHLEGNRLVSGSTDTTIKVWDLSTQHSWSSIACKLTLVGHTDTVRCLQVSEDRVISGSYDQTLKLWSMRTGRCRQTLVGHEAAVLCVHFSKTKIVSGSCDKTIKVWNFEGECMMTLRGHQDAVTCLQFDAQRIVSGSLDCNLKFWDIHTGKCRNTIDWKDSEGHTGVVRCLQADSWRVVSASDDRTLKVWSLETGQRLVTLRNHSDGVTCLQFNDSIIVSGSYDKTVKLWDFSSV